MSEELSRRDMLLQAMEANEAPEEIEDESPAVQAEEASPEPEAEESSEKEVVAENSKEPTEVSAQSESEVSHEDAEAAAEEVKPVQRPSTWKKEYVQIWDKMEKGEQISKEDFVKFAEYANQRESEYKKGVSTYKAEADRAKGYEEAIAPFVPELQKRGIQPAQYIQNLARADQILTNAPYEQKVQLFQRLAADYGIQLNGEGQAQQLDPYTQQLMSQLNQVNQEVSSIKGRFQQEENQRLMNEIERVRSDVEKYPHFDVVREEMAQLLELGKAPDLETAYKKAVRMNDEVWQLEQEKLLKDAKQAAIKAQQVAKAKAAAVSPKSVTPSGKVTELGDKKDRRSLIAEQMGEALSRRV
jgi:gas vesicle protein